jgi:hypothetical protein
MNTETANEISTLEADVRSAVEQGHDIQEVVRQLTLRRVSARSLDIESLRQIASAVLRGARSAVQKEIYLSAAQTETARIQLKQAVAGLDMALAQLVEAAKLSVEEAASRAQKFSSEDLTQARADLGSIEEMFIETLQLSASSARDTAGDILHNLTSHTRLHGSNVGVEVKEALVVISHQISATGHAQVTAGLHLAQVTTGLLRQITAGVLTGLADHIQPAHAPIHPKDKDA